MVRGPTGQTPAIITYGAGCPWSSECRWESRGKTVGRWLDGEIREKQERVKGNDEWERVIFTQTRKDTWRNLAVLIACAYGKTTTFRSPKRLPNADG